MKKNYYNNYRDPWRYEGSTSYLHARIIREMELTSDEAIEFAKLNAGVVQPSRTQINPYYLGLKIFEVREVESDISFIRNYLTKDLVIRQVVNVCT